MYQLKYTFLRQFLSDLGKYLTVKIEKSLDPIYDYFLTDG